MIRTLTYCVLPAVVVLSGCLAGGPNPTVQVLLRETFDDLPAGALLPAGWWAEGSASVRVTDGCLVQNTNPDAGADNANSVVWIGTEFDGDVTFAADVGATSAKGNVNDIVLFFLFSDPDGTPLKDTQADRASGKQGLYTDRLNGYVVFYWGKGGVTTPANIRFRDCPGAHLLLEKDAHSVETGRVYRLVVSKQGTVLRLSVDGTLLAEHDTAKDDIANPQHTKGLIGLKTWNTEVRWDNITVTKPIPR